MSRATVYAVRSGLLVAALLVATIAGTGAARAASVTVRAIGSAVLGTSSVVEAALGATLEFEVVLDTEGETWEGYSYALLVSGGSVGSLVLTRVASAVEPLVPDLLGAPLIDEQEASIRNITTGLLQAGPGRDPGVYVIDRVAFSAAEIPEQGIVVSPILGVGDTFGLGETGAVPRLYGVTVVPEPASGVLASIAVAVLFAKAQRRRR